MGQRSILLVDTPAGPLRSIAASLQQNGCAVHVAEGPREALQQAMERLPDVIVLSRTLEETDLVDLCRSLLRNLGTDVSPAILIAPAGMEGVGTAVASRLAESLALDLLAQSVRTLTYRAKYTGDDDAPLECHGVRLDWQTGFAEMDSQPLELTPTEFRLLQALMAQPGHVLSRQQLEEALGSPTSEPDPSATADAATATESRKRRIDVHIKSIRGKLAHKGSLIETVRGVGYRFREPAWNLNVSQ